MALRIAGFISGSIWGLIFALVLAGIVWLLKTLAQIPLWYTLATWAYLTLFALLLIALITVTGLYFHTEFDARRLVPYVTGITLIGLVSGTLRVAFHWNDSVYKFGESLLRDLNQYCFPMLIVCGFGYTVLVWLVTKFASVPSLDNTPFGNLIGFGVLICLAVMGVGLLTDAPLVDFLPLRNVINQQTPLTIFLGSVGLWGLLGLLFPPRLNSTPSKSQRQIISSGTNSPTPSISEMTDDQLEALQIYLNAQPSNQRNEAFKTLIKRELHSRGIN